jgi:hypothetical protein
MQSYRIAVGPHQGRKVFTLQTLPDCGSENPCTTTVGEAAGFSLHAGVATKANERAKLERLCRYITRPAVSTKRLSLTRNGRLRYELKTPWRNGTTHVIFEPLDFMFRMNGMPQAQGCAGAAVSRLVALVPKPRVNLTRFHGVFAPNSKYRAQVTPAKRGNVKKPRPLDEDQTLAECKTAMTWAQRLKRVFNIDIAYMDVGKGREQDAVASKSAVSAVVMSELSPVSKSQRLFRRYLPTWMTVQLLQHQDCYRNAGPRQAH